MPINQDIHYIIKNGIVEQPAVAKDGLELYYDAKGKHNSDVHKGTLLDLSGNNRHGTLVNFAYEGVSGYQENSTGGILLDDVDDKIVRPAISGIEYTSASRNLFDGVFEQGHWNNPVYNTNRIRSKKMLKLESGKTYTFSTNLGAIDSTLSFILGMFIDEGNYYTDGVANPVSGWTGTNSYTFTPTIGTYMSILIKRTEDVVITPSVVTSAMFFQLEEGSVATPYTPYIPLPIMTYQMNGNILSFEKDGTVKRTTKDANGNEVVVSRKGINLLKNNNISPLYATQTYINGVFRNVANGTSSSARVLSRYTDCGTSDHYLYVSAKAMVESTASSLNIYYQDSVGNQLVVELLNPTPHTWYDLKGIIKIPPETPNTGTHEIKVSHVYLSSAEALGKIMFATDLQVIDLTAAYGSANIPTIQYVNAHPEEYVCIPNPNILIETTDIARNILGDLENLQGNDFEQHEDGVITYTNEAEEGSVVRVDIDGVSFQDVGSGKNIFYKNELYSKYSDINDDCLNISIGDRFFYQIDGVPNAQYTTSFDYKRDNATAPVSMSFYYTDGTSDENHQLMSSSDRVRLTLSSAIGKTVSGVGYNPPVVLGCSWKKISNPTMERTGLALSLAQEDESLGVRWNKLQNPIMERV